MEGTPRKATITGRRLIWGGMRKHWLPILGGSLLMVVLAGISVLPPLVTRNIIDGSIVRKDVTSLAGLCLILGALYIVISVLNWLTSLVFTKVSQKALHEIRRIVFTRIVNLPVGQFEGVQTGYLMARMGEISSLGLLFSSSTFRMGVSLLEFVGALAIMFRMNAGLTRVVLGVVPLYYIAASVQTRGYRLAAKMMMQANGLMAGKVQETFMGIKEVKNLRLEAKRTQEAVSLSQEFAQASTRQGVIAATSTESLVLLSSIVSTAVLFLAGRRIINDTLTIGTWIAFSTYIGKMISPVSYFATFGLSVQPALAALERTAEFLSQSTEEERDTGKPLIDGIHTLEFRNVSFRYPNEPQRLVLDHINWSARRPSVTTIIGPNGSGKSTLIKLLLGYYPAYEGEVLVNGVELRELNVLSLRNRIAVVSQQPFLFQGTVADNLTAVEGVTLDSLKTLSSKGNGVCEALIRRLPLGLATPIAEGGANLSGGQRKIVAILRALLGQSDIVVFDEVTANLDDAASDLAKEAVKSVFADRLCIVVTHDRSWEGIAHNEIQLVEGRLVS